MSSAAAPPVPAPDACDYITLRDLEVASTVQVERLGHPAAVLLLCLVCAHCVILAASVLLDGRRRRSGQWKEEYFLSRDSSHHRDFDPSLYARLRRVVKGVWGQWRRGGGGIQWFVEVVGVYHVQQAAGYRAGLTQVDVRFMLQNMHQVNFASHESEWTRQRNAKFMKIQLEVHKAVHGAHAEFMENPASCSMFWQMFGEQHPYWSLQRFCLVCRSSMRALLLTADVFGRVGLSVLYFASADVARASESGGLSCPELDLLQRLSADIARGFGLEMLFGTLSVAVWLLWEVMLSLLSDRNFVYDPTWTAERRQQQVCRWWLKDTCFAVLVVVYSTVCACIAFAFLNSITAEDGNRWLASFVTMLLCIAFFNPLLTAGSCAFLAERAARQKSFTLERCLGMDTAGMAKEPLNEVMSPATPGPRLGADEARSLSRPHTPLADPPPLPSSRDKSPRLAAQSMPREAAGDASVVECLPRSTTVPVFTKPSPSPFSSPPVTATSFYSASPRFGARVADLQSPPMGPPLPPMTPGGMKPHSLPKLRGSHPAKTH
eukprot:TRINITY_DN60161_c0_g1_i1.p1 TRINITY_DN60161_c0_g1~~TRINITY_DN60161_c0_g1_i1.p1  ORF type:complete len:577 (-),score=43.38 TRINITY_DN60161_c0_g1_i1:192-1832(-)